MNILSFNQFEENIRKGLITTYPIEKVINTRQNIPPEYIKLEENIKL